MPPSLPAPRFWRPSLSHSTATPCSVCSRRTFASTPTRAATLLKRPKRPYTFTQLITLSDGSTFTHRTTSPLAVYKSAKDIRNTPLWNPSNMKLANVEEDEAGRLRAFRKRFGRGWDAQEVVEEEEVKEEEDVAVVGGAGARTIATESDNGKSAGKKDKDKEQRRVEENLMDLIGSYSTEAERNASAPAAGDYRPGKGGKKGKR